MSPPEDDADVVRDRSDATDESDDADDWDRRHGHVEANPSRRWVRADPPKDDWEARHAWVSRGE